MKKFFSFFIIVLFLFILNCQAVTKAPVDITTMDIAQLSMALEKGYITSETLVKLYLERIETYDGMFNSINQLNEKALEQAKELDKERKEGKIRGVLHGIPLLVKCNIDVYGIPSTGGTKSLLDNMPLQNSYVVQKLVDQGAIILGSTNMSELAFSARNSYSSYGYVKNVFDYNYTPYGSSGGAAVAVKAAFAAASLGTDTNSSVRLPAAGAGLVGIRPTLGLVSRNGVIPYDVTRDTVGVLSRNVADNALLLSIIAGEDAQDEITNKAVVGDFSLSNTSLNGIRIGVPTQYLKGKGNSGSVTSETDSDIYKLSLDAINKLEASGATIIYLDSFVKNSNLTIASQTQAGFTMCDGFNQYIKGTTGTIRSFQKLASASGHVQNLEGYVSSCGAGANLSSAKINQKNEYRNYVDSYFADYDLDAILYPTLKNKPFKYNEQGANISPGSSLGSVIGYPSITVPMGYDSNGFAYGIEFLGLAYNESMLYNIALEFEKVNKNIISTSSLTPSLYDIPQSVERLIINYESILLKNSNNKMVINWVDNVKSFFENYNDYDNVDEEATKLIEIFDKNYLDSISSKKNNFKITKVFGYIFFILATMVMLFIFFKEFFERN